MLGAARATREANVHFMVEEMEGIRLWKNGGRGVDHLSFIYVYGLHIPQVEHECRISTIRTCSLERLVRSIWLWIEDFTEVEPKQ